MTTKLKHAAEIRVSNIDKKSVDGEQPVQVVNYTDVYYGNRLGPSSTLKRATAAAAQISQFRLREGDVLITKDSESADDIGVPAFVVETAPDLVCGYHLALLRPRSGTKSAIPFLGSWFPADSASVRDDGDWRDSLRSQVRCGRCDHGAASTTR